MKVYIDQIQQLAQYNALTKADNMTYDEETNTLQLQAMGMPIGNPVVFEECDLEDGVPVVDFTTIEPDDGDKEVNNVVEF